MAIMRFHTNRNLIFLRTVIARLGWAEVGPAEAFGVAVAHGEFEHEGGENPLAPVGALFEVAVPLLHLGEGGGVGADVARGLPLARGYLQLGDNPFPVGVVALRPAGEQFAEGI